jgi:hypothetical protein
MGAILPEPPRAPDPDCWTRNLWNMVVYPQDRLDLQAAFVNLARPLGPSFSRVLAEEKVKVVIVPKECRISEIILPEGLRLAHEGAQCNVGPLTRAAGFYCFGRRVAAIRESHLRGTTVIHELAHSIDDVLTRRCRLPQRVSSMLWERFPQGRRLVVGRHPDISPAEFFAISLELYFSPGGRKKIQARDPALLEFLDFFLLPDSK